MVADTLVFAPSATFAGLLLGPTHASVTWCYRKFARVALLGVGARLRSNGDAHLDPDRRFVFVANHTSHLDSLAIVLALERHPIRFVAKQELGRIPLLGAALRATGSVMVSRSDPGRDVAALDTAQRQLLRGVSVLFFAEGTRSATGELGPFKRGAAAFALKSALAAVPVGVHGSAAIYDRGFEVRRAGTIGVSIGAPLPTAGRSLDEREAFTAELRQAVAAQIEKARELAAGG